MRILFASLSVACILAIPGHGAFAASDFARDFARSGDVSYAAKPARKSPRQTRATARRHATSRRVMATLANPFTNFANSVANAPWTNGRNQLTGATLQTIFTNAQGVFSTICNWDANGVCQPIIPAGYITNALLAPGAAVANIGFAPVNKAGDTMSGALNVVAPSSADVSAAAISSSWVRSNTVNRAGDTMTGALGVVAPIASDNSALAVSSAWVRSLFATLNASGNPKAYGAACDGVADDSSALSSMMTALGSATVPYNCTLRIATATILAGPVTMAAGGVLKPDGVVLTFGKALSAPLVKVFSPVNGGSVAFVQGAQETAVPEWWGTSTTTASGNPDWQPALYAAIHSGAARVRLSPIVYHTGSTVVDDVNGVEVFGPQAGWNAISTLGTTNAVISLDSATGDTFQLGPSTAPVNGTFLVRGQSVHHFDVVRNQAPSCTNTGTTAPSAMLVQFTGSSRVDHIGAVNGCTGFHIKGTAANHIENNQVGRTLPSASANELNVGFFVDPYFIGFAGGNASLYMATNTFLASMQTNYVMLVASSPFSDLFVRDMEGGFGTCALITGNYSSSATINNAYKSANEDVTLEHLVCDQMTQGIVVSNINEFGTLTIKNSYVALGSNASAGAVRMDGNHGSVNLIDNELLGWVANEAGLSVSGLYVTNGTVGLTSRDNRLIGFKIPELVNASGASEISDTISVPNSADAPSQALVTCTGCFRTRIAPTVIGPSGAASSQPAISIDSTSTYNEVNPTKVQLSIVSAKVQYNGATTTSATFGTGNVQSGVLN